MSEFSMEGFSSDPFAASDFSLGSGIYDIDMAASIAGDSMTESIGGYSPVSDSSSFSSAKDIIDYGLKISDAAIKTYSAVQNQALQTYLVRNNASIDRANSDSARDVNKLLATSKVNQAQALNNLTRAKAVASELGQSPNSLMLYLTIIGVVFAGIQVLKSAK